MNVTKKPFEQLAIMRDRIKNQRRIKDCYKLLRDREVIRYACQQLTCSEQAINNTSAKLFSIINTPQHLSQLTSTEDAILSETCLFIVQELFIAQQFLINQLLTTRERLQRMRGQFQTVNWVISIELLLGEWTGLKHCLDLSIDDPRFKLILFRVLDKLQVQDYPRFQKISSAIYFSIQLLPSLKPVLDWRLVYEHNRIYLGLSATKQEICSLYHRLYSELNKQVDCYFSHFSQPLLYQGYAVRRNRQSKKISIEVPQQELIKLSALFQYGDFHNRNPRARGGLVHRPIPAIYSIYEQELIQVAFDYRYADNYRVLGHLVYFAQLSLLKTIALKQGCTMGQANYLLKTMGFKQLTLPKQTLIN